MTCHEFQQHHLQAFVDGAIADPQRRESEQHLAACRDCRAMVDQMRETESRLQDLWRAEPVPEGLWERVQARLDHTEPKGRGAWFTRRLPAWTWLAATAAALALAVGLSWFGSLMPSMATRQAQLLSVPVDDLHTFVVSKRRMDADIASPAPLRQWFQDKVAFSPPLLPANVAKAKLVGGRLCHFLDRRVASFMYESEGRYISVYVMPHKGLTVPAGQGVDLHRAQAMRHEIQGYTNLMWSNMDLLYAVVSDLPQGRLQEVAREIAQAGWAHRRQAL